MIRITAAGWVYIILTLFLGIAAVNTGNNLIYLLVAALLSFLVVSGVFGRHNLARLKISYTVPEEVYAESETPLFIHLLNARRRYPAFLIWAGGREGKVFFPFVYAGRSTTGLCSWRSGPRGSHSLPAVYLSSPFPFGFFIRYKKVSSPEQEVIVFPHPQRSFFPGDEGKRRRDGGETYREEKGFEGEIFSVRDYQAGDPLRFIHWKASARTGSFKTKDFSAAAMEPLFLDIALLPGKDLEIKLSHLCFLIKESLDDMRPVILRLDGDMYGPGKTREDKLKMLRALATYRNE
ncbi:MAG: DUF58 domain-containing protein [Syntrophobacterales bacterium]|nr:DUF58 domain-containing protein [Syntrophobacterales bacterium]